MRDYRDAELSEADERMLDFAVKLTRAPASMRAEDLLQLKSYGFDDAAILQIVHITGFFNYINRVADALGVDPEPEWAASPLQAREER